MAGNPEKLVEIIADMIRSALAWEQEQQGKDINKPGESLTCIHKSVYSVHQQRLKGEKTDDKKSEQT
ncbi:MAG: hypothetical protein JW762_03215 [Dehalococcoidales bacterium]|nr:hypothetical protein [Dehalococcoidales bacterium]